MRSDRDEETVRITKQQEQAIMLVGMVLLFSGLIISAATVSDGPLSKLAGVGALVGSALYLLPEYLHLRLWPFLGVYLAMGIVGVILAPSVAGLICILGAVFLLFLSGGLRWWKIRKSKRV